jgi:DNA helicase-2/ATP-dependent DNA helicase PcrA
MAWAALAGVPESSVRTAFHYVRARTTVIPDELPGTDELARLLMDPDGDRCVQV